jgi:signal transduction histidine kinase
MEKKRVQNYKRKMKNLSHELTLAEEHERKRIATTLHAEIGQILAFLKLKIGEVKEKESSLNTEGELEEIYNLVQNAITSTRSLMSQISPTILYELGFIPAVDWLAENILKENNIKYSFKDDGKEKPLTDDLRILLFQAVRELLVNIRKHANAKKVKIYIKRKGENIEIDVQDDGIGFDTSTLDSYDEKDVGFGLLNIRNRIDVVGGFFEIESKKNKGTKITLKVPLQI